MWNSCLLYFRVRLGENYLNTYQDCDKFKVCAPLPQDIKINKFIYHNKYCPLTSANDYAVIELKDAAKFNGRFIMSDIF